MYYCGKNMCENYDILLVLPEEYRIFACETIIM